MAVCPPQGRVRREWVRLAAARMFDQAVTAVQIARELRVTTKSVYAPDLNPGEGVWASVKNGLGNLAAQGVDHPAAIIRNRWPRANVTARRPIAAYRPRNPIGLAMFLSGCVSGVGKVVTYTGRAGLSTQRLTGLGSAT